MDFRPWLYAAGIVACTAAATVAAAPRTAKAAAVKPDAYVADTDCAQARKLPAEVDDAARRIVCEIPGPYQEEVSRAEVFGALLRRHDLAAWLTSDALVEAGAMRDLPGEPSGWLTYETGGRIEVRYFVRGKDGARAFASAALPLRAPLKAVDARRLDPPRPAVERERRLLAAIKLARAQKMTYCSDAAPNTVAIEYAENDEPAQILVFLMSPWNDDSAPLGGHARFRLSHDGDRVLDRYEQTNACVTMPAKELPKVAALTVTHVTSAAPTYFHAFMSLQYRKPMFVYTTQNRLLWKVEGGRVRLLSVDSAEAVPLRDWIRTLSDDDAPGKAAGG